MNDDYITACCGQYPDCSNCPYEDPNDETKTKEVK